MGTSSLGRTSLEAEASIARLVICRQVVCPNSEGQTSLIRGVRSQDLDYAGKTIGSGDGYRSYRGGEGRKTFALLASRLESGADIIDPR